MFAKARVRDLPPTEVRRLLEQGAAMLVDVREAHEFAAQRIEGAVNLPLSRFDPADLPDANGRAIVLQCGSGKRSVTAFERCRAAGAAVDSHLAGGIAAWLAAGLPTVR